MKTIAFHLNSAYSRLMNIHGEPRPVALGYALGVFMATTPLMGVHCILAVMLASVFRWNRLAAGIGAFHSNLLTAPLLYSSTYFIGANIIGSNVRLVMPERPAELLSKGADVLMSLTVGGFIVGIPFAIVSYYISFLIIKRYRIYYANKTNHHENKS